MQKSLPQSCFEGGSWKNRVYKHRNKIDVLNHADIDFSISRNLVVGGVNRSFWWKMMRQNIKESCLKRESIISIGAKDVLFLNVSLDDFQRRNGNRTCSLRPETHPPRVGNLKFECQVDGCVFGGLDVVW